MTAPCKPHAQKMGLVTRHWSGKHRQVVQGINPISLMWTDGDGRLPCDFRLYNKAADGLSKNDHFRQMIDQAKQRGFAPELVITMCVLCPGRLASGGLSSRPEAVHGH